MCCCSPTTSSNSAAGTGVCSRSAARISGATSVGGVDHSLGSTVSRRTPATVPLVNPRPTGKKFGKSTGGGSLWLDPELTSPYVWPSTSVNDRRRCRRYLRWFTFLTRDEIDELLNARLPRLRTRVWRSDSAAEMTTLIHGAEQTQPSNSPVRRCSAGRAFRRALAAAAVETTMVDFGGGAADPHRTAGRNRPVGQQQGRLACCRRRRRIYQPSDHRPRWSRRTATCISVDRQPA